MQKKGLFEKKTTEEWIEFLLDNIGKVFAILGTIFVGMSWILRGAYYFYMYGRFSILNINPLYITIQGDNVIMDTLKWVGISVPVIFSNLFLFVALYSTYKGGRGINIVKKIIFFLLFIVINIFLYTYILYLYMGTPNLLPIHLIEVSDLISLFYEAFLMVIVVNFLGIVFFISRKIMCIIVVKHKRLGKDVNSSERQQSLYTFVRKIVTISFCTIMGGIIITFFLYLQGRTDAKKEQSYSVYMEKINIYEEGYGNGEFCDYNGQFYYCYAVVYENGENYFLSKIIDLGPRTEIDHSYIKMILKEGIETIRIEDIQNIKKNLTLQ